jgi:LPXTG-motif cell wall-anchored protein
MTIKKRPKLNTLLVFVSFLSLFIIPQETVKAAVTEGQTEYVGYLGSRHILSASDFRIPLADVKKMDLVARSNASVHDTVAQQKSTDGIHIRKNEVVERPGEYDVQFGIDQDQTVTKDIRVVVYDETQSPDTPKSEPTPGPISYQPGNTGVKTPVSSLKQLPTTGETVSTYAGIIGILLLLAALILRSLKKKNKEQG